MFGYVQSPGTPIAAFADLLASTLNANLTIWRSAPAPVELERLTIDWIRQILGFNAEAGGLFVSGGSMANLAALAAARQTKEYSLGRLRLYASSATHFSIVKAAALLGIGRENVQHVAVDECFRMRVDDLVAKINADLEAGYVPFCVVGMLERWTQARSILYGDSRSREPVPTLDACGWKLWCVRSSRGIGEKIVRGSGAGGFDRAGSSQMALSAGGCWLRDLPRSRDCPRPLLLMRPNTPACLAKKQTKRLYAGTTGRNCRGVSVRSKCGCC